MKAGQKIVFILLLLALSGCAHEYEMPTYPASYWDSQGFTSKELERAISYPSPVKRLWALKALENEASPRQRLDLLSLECFYSLEMVPSSPSDRQAFQEAVAKLHAEAIRTSPYNVPDDAVILMMLGGYQDVGAFIDTATRDTFNELANPRSFNDYTGSVKHQAEMSLKKNLAKATYYYVNGDMGASKDAVETAILRKFALSLDEEEEFMLPEHLKSGPKAPWEIFKWRLAKKTGIRLDAALSRLRSTTQGMRQASFQPIQ